MIWKQSNLYIVLIFVLFYANVAHSKAKQTKRPKPSKESTTTNNNNNKRQNDNNNGNNDNGREGSSATGIRFRATKIGIDYMTKVFGEVINEFVPIMHVPDIDQSFSGGTVHLSHMRIQNFKPADKYETQTKSPNRVTWSMNNMNLGIKGDLDGQYSGKSATGQFDSLSTGTNMVVTTTLTKEKSASGNQLKATAVECKITMKTFDFNVYNLPESYQRLFQQYKTVVVNFLKPKLQDQLCKKIKTFINEDLNEKLKQVTGKQSLKSALRDDEDDNDQQQKQQQQNQQSQQQQNQQSQQQQNQQSQQQQNQQSQQQQNQQSQQQLDQQQDQKQPKMAQQVQDILNNMYIDYSLTDNPKLTPDYVDLFENGEVSFHGTGGTPFGPDKMNDRSEDMLNRMVYLSISDFVMNSLFYQSYEHKLLNLKFNKETTPEAADFLRTKCGSAICLTNVMPELAAQYPDDEFEFGFEPTEVPKMIISSGNAKVNAKGNFMLFLRQVPMKTKEIMRAALNAEADVKPQLNGSLIQGHMLITALNAKLLSTEVKNLNQARIDQLIKGARTLLQLKGNRMLRDGVPLPASNTYRLVDPKLYLFDRHIRIETDIELNKAALVNQVAKDLEKAHTDSNKN